MRRLAVLLLALPLAACSKPEPVTQVVADVNDERIDDLARVEPATGDSPWWRGPERNGHFQAANLPRTWSDERNVAWKRAVPGRGHASPCIWGEYIFLATADEQAKTQSLVCLDRASGEEKWTAKVHEGGLMNKHNKNSHASATPACDGEHVFVPFTNDGGLWLTAINFAGNIAWQKNLGAYVPRHGFGSSPVLYKSLVIVAGDNLGASFLAAVHRATGEVVWRVPRPSIGSYATPVVLEVKGRPQLLLHGAGQTASYNPDTGEELWSVNGPSEVAACTPATDGKLVFSTGGYPEKKLLAIDAQAGKAEVVWSLSRKSQVAYVPSPLYHEGLLYVVNDDGIANCINAESGEVIWTERLGGNFSASPVLADGAIYVPNEQGKTYVLKPGREYELLAENNLPEGALATPVPVDGAIYLRTTGHLYRLAEAAAE